MVDPFHRAVLLPLALATACGGARSSTDTAQVCFGWPESESTPPFVADGEPLTLTAVASFGCHSADHAVSCAVTMAGDTLTVHTETTWEATEPLAMNCESILYSVEGTCDSPPLVAGTWTVVYAGEESTVEVPGPIVADCLGGS